MSFEEKKVGQFKCQSCGGGLELSSKRTKYVSCPYCGSVADASTDAYKILTKGVSPDKFKPRSFIKLGMLGDFDGKEYKVIGRTCWRNDYKEYWAEDGETGYSDEKWTFDEWILIGEDGSYMSIIEDDERFAFAESIIPKYPSIPEGTEMLDFHFNEMQRVVEYGDSEILYFEGESTYLVKPGNVVKFSQYKGEDADYIAEWRFFENGEIKEVEFFAETKIFGNELKKAFRLIDETKKETATPTRSDDYKTNNQKKRIWFFAGLLNFIIGIIIVISSPYGDTVNLYEYNGIIHEGYNPVKWIKITDSTKAIGGFLPEKFIIKPEYEEIELRMNYQVPATSFEGKYITYFKNSKGKVVFEHSQYNYHFTYYKKTGYKAHNAISFIEKFNVTGLSGEYTVEFQFEVPMAYKETSLSDEKIGTSLKILEIKQGWGGGAFIFFGIVMLLISLFIKILNKP